MEYGSHSKANHLKRQRELLADATGTPIVILDCYANGDVVAVTGEYKEMTKDGHIVVVAPRGTTDYPPDARSELLIGHDDIGEYVESSLELYENESDIAAGIAAVTLTDRFPDHFPALPTAIIESIAARVCMSDDHQDYIGAAGAGETLRERVDVIMGEYIRQFTSLTSALRSGRVAAYIEAMDSLVDAGDQMRFLKSRIGT